MKRVDVAKPQRHLQKKKQQRHHQQIQQLRRRRRPHLIKGSLVEVSTDEEGFGGAWFVATVLKPPSSRKRNTNVGKVYVEYKSLVSEEDNSKPLREYVNAALVRPVPPVENHSVAFNIGDLVDAYYSDGWWTGVITRLVGVSGFLVTFQNPPDAIEFGPSDLRFHREWVNGSWIPPANQRAAGLMFSVGKRVEVSFDASASQDVWFPATVLEEKGNGVFLVECQKSDGSGGSWTTKETVDSHHIRPCPLHLKEKSFFLLEKVDAFYDFGWWSGVITKELTDSRYIVFFKHTKKEREFDFSELRPHMEWKDGKWSTSSQDVSIPSDYRSDEGYFNKNARSIGVVVPHPSSVSTKSTSEGKMPFSSTSRKNEIEEAAPCNDEPLVIDSTPRETLLGSPCFIGKETLDVEAHPGASSPVTDKYKSDTTGAVKFSLFAGPDSLSVKNDISRQTSGADQQHEGHPLRKRVKRKRVKSDEKEEIALVRSRKTAKNKVLVKKSRNLVGGMEGNETEGAVQDVPRDCPTVEANLPVVLGLACDDIRSSGSKRSSRSNGEEAVKRIGDWASFDETELHSVKVTNQFEVMNGSQKKRRGRPPKSVAKPSITSMFEKDVASGELFIKKLTNKDAPLTDIEVATSVEASTLGQVLAFNGSCEVLPNSQIKLERQSGSKNSTSPLSIGSENAVEASIKMREWNPTKRGRKKTMNLNMISQVHDVASPNSVEGKTAKASYLNEEVERAIDGSPNNTLDNQPLSKWFGDLHSTTSIDSSRSSLTRSIAEMSGEPMEIIEEATAAIDEIRPVGSELQSLPFEKKSPLWAAIESMEVFRKLPQGPHFKPLEHVKENLREGLAIGCMVTFTGVVERTSKLQFDDPKGFIDDILETLLELETHGFDVGVVRERINNLGHMKERQEKLEEEVEKIMSEMAERELEKCKIDEEMEEITKQIKELQGKLTEAMSMKEIKNGEIESLQLKLKVIKECISSIRCEFEGQGSWL